MNDGTKQILATVLHGMNEQSEDDVVVNFALVAAANNVKTRPMYEEKELIGFACTFPDEEVAELMRWSADPSPMWVDEDFEGLPEI